jgi:RNA polymerase sigma factor (sigma-70 family)
VAIKEEQIPELIRLGEDRKVIPLLYKKVLPQVEKYILKNSGNKEDAFDMFQDALLIFYKQVIKNSFDPKYKVFGYLYRISLNLWLNKIKKDRKLQLVEEIMEPEPETMEIKESLFALKNENLLETLFSGIGEKCVELLTYSIYYNLLMEDILIRMNFPSISAVKMQQQRCKQKLMSEIEKNPLLVEKLREL